MLILQDVSYIHPGGELLFENVHFSIEQQTKTALVGNNGVGKSTLLKIIAGVLKASGGIVHITPLPYYIPQLFGQFNDHTIAQALNIERKLKALHEILAGNADTENLALLDEDWTIEERCQEALGYWNLDGLDLTQKLETLSGGQKTKVFLAGMMIHQPDTVLMDEPSNHLDLQSRKLLYTMIQATPCSLLVVSHDRTLLNLLDSVHELSKHGMTLYGGNYELYAEQKEIENNALASSVKSKARALKKAKETARETMERKQRLDARGKKKQEKAGMPTAMMKVMQDTAAKSAARTKDVHSEKIAGISQELSELKKDLPEADKMRFNFDHSLLHKGKILVKASAINFSYANKPIWQTPLDIKILSGERWAIHGGNGSGKTTLIKILLGELEPLAGNVQRAEMKAVYVDQDYSLVNSPLSIEALANRFNVTHLPEHEVKTRLDQFLFAKSTWEKSCHSLSGGEKMRLTLCCLSINNKAPDMIVLDEPTNNLDIQNIGILTGAVNDYEGTLLVVSHDEYFLKDICAAESIALFTDAK